MPFADTIPTIKDFDHTRGPLSASLLMMSYGSYQCPQSGLAHQTIERMRRTLGHQICFIYRHFPQPERYPQSQKAAETAEAAGRQGKFWEMHDILFDNQDVLDDASLVEYADQLGLDMYQFLQELGEHTHAMRIQADIESAHEHGVEETPTFFISLRHKGTANLEPFVQQLLDIMQKATEQQVEQN